MQVFTCVTAPLQMKLYCHKSVTQDSSELTSHVECRRQNMQALCRMDDEVQRARQLKQEQVDHKLQRDDLSVHVSCNATTSVCM